ncbi:GNAT superfamily N-acetyltransferase [Silvimonas terrae]|uniref:GNAT superfamily N-acetyltransferase n=1 Tax=Silvimonas terrae TaxID=300266 RepID=A0A840RMY8_9NEIS|nr:GNAT family N-acetyltransferase [Silvimonas terrae]MBB5193533.1 GNAT superfamily N-acetyltransferase [Silvimonas terrae]
MLNRCMGRLLLRQLDRHNPADAATVQQVFDAAPDFSMQTEGRLPAPGDGQQALDALPPDFDYANKFVFALEMDGKTLGVADLLRGYPAEHCAFLGLLLFAQPYQGQGLGKLALAQLLDLARAWGCQEMQLGVIASYERAMRFWQARQFTELYRKEVPDFISPVVVMRYPLELERAGD